jgi:hypothetical protein
MLTRMYAVSPLRPMAIAEPITIGVVNAIAAAGMLANAKAPPPSIPAQRQAMMT